MPADYLRSIALVAAGGALGSVLRFVAGGWVAARLGASFPWGTLAVNVTGCFAFGVVLGALPARPETVPLRAFLATGVLGGYTTFSAFAFETVALAGRGAAPAAAGYVVGSVVAGVAAAAAGAALARALAGTTLP